MALKVDFSAFLYASAPPIMALVHSLTLNKLWGCNFGAFGGIFLMEIMWTALFMM